MLPGGMLSIWQSVQVPLTVVDAWHLSQVKSVSVCRMCEFARAVPGPWLVNIGMEAFHSCPDGHLYDVRFPYEGGSTHILPVLSVLPS